MFLASAWTSGVRSNPRPSSQSRGPEGVPSGFVSTERRGAVGSAPGMTPGLSGLEEDLEGAPLLMRLGDGRAARAGGALIRLCFAAARRATIFRVARWMAAGRAAGLGGTRRSSRAVRTGKERLAVGVSGVSGRDGLTSGGRLVSALGGSLGALIGSGGTWLSSVGAGCPRSAAGLDAGMAVSGAGR